MKTAAFFLIVYATSLASAQTDDPAPKFLAADVHVAAKSNMEMARPAQAHNGRYEIRNATIVDLIRFAFDFNADKVLGGPSWLEMDRFDIAAKEPPDTTPDSRKLMLQGLLADRFKLVVHKESKPLPTYALVAGKKPLLKEATGTEDAGCKPQSTGSGAPGEGGMRIMFSSDANSAPITLNLGPGGLVQYQCQNMTMAAFVGNLRSMIGANVGQNPIIDDTGLKGNWNFDLRYSLGFIGPAMQGQTERVTIFEAVDKQLGLKLEERQVPTPVMVVDSVNEKPSDNPPGTADILPPIPPPTEFEVASVKPSDPGANMGRMQMNGGRVSFSNIPMHTLLIRAFNTNNRDEISGLPAWVDSARFDIDAKPPAGVAVGPLDMETVAPMMLALLKDRFKLAYHSEEKQVTAYNLVEAKPKMKKADPNSRTFCKNVPAPAGAPPRTQVLNCQNITMDQFADRLRNMAPDLSWPVINATELKGGWDFTLTYSFAMMAMPVGAAGGRGGAEGGDPSASDPTGGLSIFEAVEKQLGLKLEKGKRNVPVIVIDHLEQKPTEN